MTIVEAWSYFQNHLIDEMAVSDSDDDDAKEAYEIVSDFIEAKIKAEQEGE